ncbi:hypothetical protein OBV_39050 [Oscillibacter valericigenes Sjm18-20]|nr:hypothetical protein OBV_39050 [Oscillibacter valericigenes Sjm18-20]
MIFDFIGNAAFYFCLDPRLKKGLEYLATCDFSAMPDGRYSMDGDDLFMNITTYNTRSMSESKLEAHREYWDIQYIISGRERVAWLPLQNAVKSCDADPEHDLFYYEGNHVEVPFPEGCFMVLFKDDVHAPCQHWDETAWVRKAVIKVRVK